MAGKIFINYRRDDSAAHALNIFQYMEVKFGARNVFMDIDRMRAGENFHEKLEKEVKEDIQNFKSFVEMQVLTPQKV